MNCPNEHLSAHRGQVGTNYRGECLDCGRKLQAVPVIQHRRGRSLRGAYHAQIEYNGAPE